MKHKIIITGGHLTPAIATIEALKEEGGWEITYIGRKTASEGAKDPSVESEIIPQLGVTFTTIETGRLQRQFTRHTIPSLVRFFSGCVQAYALLGKIDPDIVVSFGGYIALTVSIAAALRKIPIVTHEQTLTIGLSNRLIGRFASRIALSWKTSAKTEERKSVLTGLPVRREITNPDKLPKSKFALNHHLPTLLIVGGNQGSHSINKLVIPILKNLADHANIIFQTGSVNTHSDYETAVGETSTLTKPGKIHVRKYFYPGEYGAILNQADLTMGRSGANTIAELAILGKPALLIPLPWSGGNEQEKNAQLLVNKGSVVLSQHELTSQKLLSYILSTLKELDSFKSEANKAKDLIIPNATHNFVELIKSQCH